jgi:hypothetical protein
MTLLVHVLNHSLIASRTRCCKMQSLTSLTLCARRTPELILFLGVGTAWKWAVKRFKVEINSSPVDGGNGA